MTEPREPDYKKYEDITNILAKDAQEHVSGLETAIVIAWAEHIKGVSGDNNQGDGLIEKLYGSAEEYIRGQHMGGKIPEDQYQRTIVDTTIRKMIGFKPSDETYKGKKKVNFEEVAGLIKESKINYSDFFQEQFNNRLDLLRESDLDPFRDYVLKLAKELGSTFEDITKESMPRLSMVRMVYEHRIFPALMMKKQWDERNKESKKAVDRALANASRDS